MRIYTTTFLVITVFLFSCTAKKENEKAIDKKISRELIGIVNTDSVAPPAITILADPKEVAFTKTVAKGNGLSISAGINYFTSYSPEQGAPLSRVIDFVFDKEGVVWLNGGTNLLKYDGVNFTSFGTKNGLPGMGIRSLAQDGKGNIWMARSSGLSKYDGLAFTNYDTLDVLKGNRYSIDLKNDHEGNLWFSVLGKGICKYDGSSFSVFSTKDGLPYDSIFINRIDKEGKLWLSCWNGGSGTFDGKTYKGFTKDDWTKGKTVQALFQDSKGNIWYWSSQNLLKKDDYRTYRINEGNMKFDDGIMKYDGQKTTTYTTRDGLPSNMINDITEDANGNIWFATEKGVSRYDGAHFTNYTSEHGLSHNKASKISTDPSGNIWVACLSGISKFNGTYLKQFTAEMGFNATDNGRVKFVNDSHGNLWFTVDGGIGKYDGHEFTYYIKQGFTISERYSSYGSILLAKDGSIWFGASSGGCYRFDGKIFLFYPEINTISNGILQDSKGVFWFCVGNSGVYKFDGKEYFHYSTAQGLSRNITGSVNIMGIAEDPSGNIWLGRRDGFSKYDGSQFTNYDFIKGLGNGNSSREIVSGKNGQILWASDSGLIKYDGRAITNYGKADGLADGTIGKIVEDTINKKIWVITSYGLSAINTTQIDAKTGKEMVENYNLQTGFPELSKVFIGLTIDKNGVLWLSALDKTLTRFDYGQLKKQQLPKLVINNVTLDNENVCWYNLRSSGSGNKINDSMAIVNELGMRFQKEVSAADLKEMSNRFAGIQFDSISRGNPIPFELKIPFRHNTIGFDFGVVDPANAGQVQYQFMLEGYDKTWSKLDNITKASFGNMNEGDYTFKVKARCANSRWIETDYTFTVLPPWYRTWWAYLMYVLVAGTAVFTFIRWRTKALQKEKILLEEKVNTRTIELNQSLENLKSTQSLLIQSEKMASLGELTAGIAHEIQNPLNFVNNFSEVNTELIKEIQDERRKTQDKRDEKLEDELLQDIVQNQEKINQHGKRAADIVKGMLQHSRASSGVKEPTDINALADEYLRLAYHGLRAKDKSFNATMKTDFDESIGNINIIPQDIGRVILNLINNAFYAVSEKHKAEDGKYEPTVSVSTKKDVSKVIISVKDNGNGIPQHIKDKIFQPFFTTKPTGQGTGLGLSLSYDIVKAHGGTIEVISTEGKGSNFLLTLPALE